MGRSCIYILKDRCRRRRDHFKKVVFWKKNRKREKKLKLKQTTMKCLCPTRIHISEERRIVSSITISNQLYTFSNLLFPITLIQLYVNRCVRVMYITVKLIFLSTIDLNWEFKFTINILQCDQNREYNVLIAHLLIDTKIPTRNWLNFEIK